MKTIMTAAMAAAVFAMAVPAMAQPERYDRKLEKAAADAFAARAGSIRGTFKLGEKPVLLTARMIDAGAPILGQEYRDTLRPAGFESAPPFTSFVELGH